MFASSGGLEGVKEGKSRRGGKRGVQAHRRVAERAVSGHSAELQRCGCGRSMTSRRRRGNESRGMGGMPMDPILTKDEAPFRVCFDGEAQSATHFLPCQKEQEARGTREGPQVSHWFPYRCQLG